MWENDTWLPAACRAGVSHAEEAVLGDKASWWVRVTGSCDGFARLPKAKRNEPSSRRAVYTSPTDFRVQDKLERGELEARVT